MDHSYARKQVRLRGYDYATPGYYSVTICTARRRHLFGEVVNAEMQLSAAGQVALGCWNNLLHTLPISGDAFQVMPNHVHGIVVFERRTKLTLGIAVCAYKTRVTRAIRRLSLGVKVWQKGFYDHVVRDEEDLRRIRGYIVANPAMWESDRENERRVGKDEFHEWLLATGEKSLPARAGHERPTQEITPRKGRTLLRSHDDNPSTHERPAQEATPLRILRRSL